MQTTAAKRTSSRDDLGLARPFQAESSAHVPAPLSKSTTLMSAQSRTMRKSWRLSSNGRSYVIVHRADLSADERPAPGAFFRVNLDHWLADSISRWTLLSLFRALGGQLDARAGWLTASAVTQHLKPRIQQALRDQEIVVLE